MQELKFVLLVPVISIIFTMFFRAKDRGVFLGISNLILTLVVSLALIYYSLNNVYISYQTWFVVITYLMLSLLFIFENESLEEKLPLLQILFFSSLVTLISTDIFFIVSSIIVSSIILMILLFKYGVELNCTSRKLGFILYYIIADTLLLLYLFFAEVKSLALVCDYLLLGSIFLKVLQLPLIYCYKINKKRDYIFNILLYPFVNLTVAFHLLNNFYQGSIPDNHKAWITFTVVVVSIGLAVYSLFLKELWDSIISLSIVISLHLFLLIFNLGNMVVNSGVMTAFTAASISLLFILCGDILRLFEKNTLFSIFAAKEKLTFNFVIFTILFLIFLGFSGTLYSFESMGFFDLYWGKQGVLSVTIVILYLAMIILKMLSGLKIYSLIYLRKSDVPWCSRLDKHAFGGTPWGEALVILSSIALICFLYVKTMLSIGGSFKPYLWILFGVLTFFVLSLSVYLFVYIRKRIEPLFNSAFLPKDSLHNIFCLDPFVQNGNRVNTWMDGVAVSARDRSSKINVSFFSKVKEIVDPFFNFSNDSVVLVYLMLVLGFFLVWVFY